MIRRFGAPYTGIRRRATRDGLDPSTRRNADRAANYLTNNAGLLDHPTALAAGWPIATGVIEGACRHLVKDRMDLTGPAGASTVPKPSSGCGPYAPTATSTPTGITTSPENADESTRHATPTRSSHRLHDVPSREPHQNDFQVRAKVTTSQGTSRAVRQYSHPCRESIVEMGETLPYSETGHEEVELFERVMSQVYGGQFDDRLAQWHWEGWLAARSFTQAVNRGPRRIRNRPARA